MGAEFAKEFELPVASEEEASAAEDWVREMVQQSDGKKVCSMGMGFLPADGRGRG